MPVGRRGIYTVRTSPRTPVSRGSTRPTPSHGTGTVTTVYPRRGEATPMAETVVDTTRALLDGVLAETDDAEVHFKLRTALQLLDVVEVQHEAAREALAHADLDEAIRADLRELGYLD